MTSSSITLLSRSASSLRSMLSSPEPVLVADVVVYGVTLKVVLRFKPTKFKLTKIWAYEATTAIWKIMTKNFSPEMCLWELVRTSDSKSSNLGRKLTKILMMDLTTAVISHSTPPSSTAASTLATRSSSFVKSITLSTARGASLITVNTLAIESSLVFPISSSSSLSNSSCNTHRRKRPLLENWTITSTKWRRFSSSFTTHWTR